MNRKNYLVTFGLIITSAILTYFATNSAAEKQVVSRSDVEYQIGAILFMQKSAEYRALSLQAFNWAKSGIDADNKLRKNLPKKERKKPRAVIVDIDETVLDNSPAQALGVIQNVTFNYNDWYKWGAMRKAKAIPGAVEFANYAKQNGVRIFYISNRDENPQLEDTVENLKLAGFPDVSKENVLLRVKDANGKNISTKTPRRDFVEKDYRVIFLIGDNLNDFSDVFENKTIAERFAETDKAKNLWGNKFIVIPNAMYGEWENLIYSDDKSNSTRAEKRLNALELP